MATEVTTINLEDLVMRAYTERKLYPKMSNTDFRRALRKTHGDDEAFNEAFALSPVGFRDYCIKPLAEVLNKRGLTLNFDEASYIYVTDSGPIAAPADKPDYQVVTGMIIRSYADGTVVAQLGSREDLEHYEFARVIALAKEALGLTHGAYNAYRNQFVFRLALSVKQPTPRDVETALRYAYNSVGKEPVSFQHERSDTDYPHYNEVR